MTDSEFEQLALTIKAAYPNSNVIPDAYAMKTWYLMLGDLDFRIANNAVAEHIGISPFPPSISEIRRLSAKMKVDIPDWGEAWEKVQKAIRRYGSYRETEALESLDETTREAAKRIGFRDLCISDLENLETNRAQFRDIYKAIAQRRTEEHQLSPLVLDAREKIRREYIGTTKAAPPLLIDCSEEIEKEKSEKAAPAHVDKILREFRASMGKEVVRDHEQDSN